MKLAESILQRVSEASQLDEVAKEFIKIVRDKNFSSLKDVKYKKHDYSVHHNDTALSFKVTLDTPVGDMRFFANVNLKDNNTMYLTTASADFRNEVLRKWRDVLIKYNDMKKDAAKHFVAEMKMLFGDLKRQLP